MKLVGTKVKNVKLTKRADGRDAIVHDEQQVLRKLPVNLQLKRKAGNLTKITYRRGPR